MVPKPDVVYGWREVNARLTKSLPMSQKVSAVLALPTERCEEGGEICRGATTDMYGGTDN